MRLSFVHSALCGSLLMSGLLLPRFACAQALVPPPEAGQAVSNQLGHTLPGQRVDGSVLLPNQWSLRPAGKQVALGDFPVNMALHPKGKYLAVLHSGHGKHEVAIVDLAAAQVVSRVRISESFYGLEFSPRGERVYCSGAGDEVVYAMDFDEGTGKLSMRDSIALRDHAKRGIPSGLAVSRNGKKLYAANLWGQCVSTVDLVARTNRGDIYVAPGATNFAGTAAAFKQRASLDPELDAAIKREQALLDPANPEAAFPYACRLDENRNRLYVSLWAQSCVAVLEPRSRKVVAHWPTGEHPNEMLLNRSGRLLFVVNANRNTVTVLDTSSGKTLETLNASLNTTPLPGSTPNSLALSPDETRLFIANACNNNVAVFDVSTPGKSRSLGFIPVGWYPTSVRVTADGRQLLVANGKGLISRANPRGPQPGIRQQGTQEIKDLFPGTLSIIQLPGAAEFERQMRDYTAQARLCTPQTSVPAVQPQPGNPVPVRLGEPSPIKYCIYVIKENRTYDQVLGDMPEGNGDTNLCLFPERVTPNLHKLAREFVLLDNFYVDAEVSADGHEWSMGAYATDFVEKSWPLSYGHNRTGKYPFPAEGHFPVASPANGYLWDRAQLAGITYRSYGEFLIQGRSTNEPNTTRLEALKGHFDPWYRCFDLNYPDVKRAERFLSELKRFETEGDMPRLQIVRMGNDHTCGSLAGALTPTAYVAENDRGVGLLVEGISRSKFWPQTAVFILEDDAQNGPDHVDAHRSTAWVISPYTRRAAVDSTMYSTSSMLRTMELILGLQPMSQFDAVATPMFNAFQATPDNRPYEALTPNVDVAERNPRQAWGGDLSRKMNFAKEDAADDLLLNEVIWRSVRGPDSPMPAPVRAAFVFAHRQDADND